MLPLAIFITICIASVLFLLRFLFALQAESKNARAHSAVVITHLAAHRAQTAKQVRDSAPVLTLVHSDVSRLNLSRKVAGGGAVYTKASVARERNSQFKGV
jgi:hypothetical protein